MTRRRQGGFTLVEVMVALTVLAVGMIALASLFPRGTSTIRKAKKTSAAVFASQQQIEMLRALGANDAALTAGDHPASGYDTYTDEPTLSYKYNVADLTGTLDGMKKITVTTRWQEARAESVQLVSYVRPQ